MFSVKRLCSIILFFPICVFSHFALAQKHDNYIQNEDVRWETHNFPMVFDPTQWDEWHEGLVLNAINDTLVTLNSNGEIISSLAKSWQVNPNELTYLFKLRDNLKFSSGRSLTTHDVEFSFKRFLLSQSLVSPIRHLIRGAAGLRNINDNIDGLQVISHDEIKITLNSPFQNFLYYLTQPYFGIIDSNNISNNLSIEKENTCSGAYCISEHSNNKVGLIKNPYYYEPLDMAPNTIGIYRAYGYDNIRKNFLNGTTNTSIFMSALLRQEFESYDQKATHKYIYPLHESNLFLLNYKKAPFANATLRRLAKNCFQKIDFSKINISQLVWSNSLFPPGLWGYSEQKKIDKTDGVSKDLIPIKILLVSLFPREASILIETEFRKAGFSVQFEYLTSSNYIKEFSAGNFDIALWMIEADPFSPELTIYQNFIVESDYKLPDPTGNIHKLYEDIISMKNEYEQNNILHSLIAQIDNDGIIIPIYHTGIRIYTSGDIDIPTTANFINWFTLKKIRVLK